MEQKLENYMKTGIIYVYEFCETAVPYDGLRFDIFLMASEIQDAHSHYYSVHQGFGILSRVLQNNFIPSRDNGKEHGN